MESPKRSRLYHAVCRECFLEEVFDSADAADAFVTRHVEETGHTALAERVD
ncbi:hypothetical protein SAMN04488066_10865 [Halorubrum aquaticum]|uniref:Uncharacterized protein n=1 Tax=Halorubrum aquaticum TaxID=387340 RepID=A0A1I3AYZ5_9EURY|nr:hypothetical protein [Halorubrum aquaticum]SFH55307.1 hypothetical protein SAMN04488066_10865 [Halorubrum aquaticum]